MNKELIKEKTDLPVGWKMKNLGEVCRFQNGFAFKSKTYKDEGIPVVRITNIQDESIDLSKIVYIDPKDYDKDLSKYKIIKGDLLIAMSGATTGKIGIHITEEELLLNQRVGKFEPSDNLNKTYLLNFLKTKVEESLAISAGAAQPNLSTEQIKSFQIPLPPLDQQKQIVAILDKAFAAIDTAKANAAQNLQNAKELFESYLQNVFENKGDDWEEKTLGEVCDLIKRGSQPKYTENTDSEIVLNQKCIRDHKINYSHSRRHDLKKKTINEERYIQIGDGLINSTGTGTLGRVAQVRKLNQRAFVDTHITIVRPKKELFYLDFFGWALIYIEKIIKKSGEGASGQTELSRKVVEKLIISFPNEMKIQKEIVQKLDTLTAETKKLESIYTQKIANLEEMKKSVLQKAFSGELS